MSGYVDRVRSLLAGIDGETWETRSESPSMDGGNYTFRRVGKPGIIISAHMYGHGSARADFIAEAPAAVTHLLARLDAVEKVRQELFAISNDDGWSDQHRAAYRDASRAIHTALTKEIG